MTFLTVSILYLAAEQLEAGVLDGMAEGSCLAVRFPINVTQMAHHVEHC